VAEKEYRFIFVFLTLLLLLSSSTAFAQDNEQKQEKDALLMHFTEEELQVVSATRSLKPVSHVAENMTVITAADIERMGAHSLADVLNTLTGVQVDFVPHTPGNAAVAYIQGSGTQYVTVLIDGVVINQLSNNYALVGFVPVQFIERIEIIKGPSSSSWGSALGGVINVITKGPPDKGVAGMASVSYGSNNTEDFRAEARGRKGDFGMYLYAGGIHSNGFGFGSDVWNRHFYSKLAYSLTPGTDLRMSLFYLRNNTGAGDYREYDVTYKDRDEQLFGTISLTYRLTNEITLDILGSAFRNMWNERMNYYSSGDLVDRYSDRYWRYGASGRVTYKTGAHTVVGGLEYDYGVEKADALISGRQSYYKWGVFVNDTISVGDFSVTPGIRYDNTDIGGDFISPSLGVTYKPTRKTILRANVARGFCAPTMVDKYYTWAPNYDLKVTRVWSYQAGAETAELKYVWLKASVFRHDIKDAIEVDWTTNQSVNTGRQRSQGFEAEMKTMTLYNAWLSAGFMFVDARDINTDQVIRDVPRYAYDLALNYDDKKSFRAMLRGRYVWWNTSSAFRGQYSSFIFDLSAAKKVYTYGRHAFELFAAAHNLFSGKQYSYYTCKNPKTWAEIGVRYKF
jgi:vitamin B12 transporter